MTTPRTASGKAMLTSRIAEYWNDHYPDEPTEAWVQQETEHILAIEAEAIRDYLTSPAAERALAEALPEHEGCTPEAHVSCIAYARAILAALPEGTWPLPDDVRIPEGFMAVQASTIRERDATITALRAALNEIAASPLVSRAVAAKIAAVLADTAAAAEQAKAAIEKPWREAVTAYLDIDDRLPDRKDEATPIEQWDADLLVWQERRNTLSVLLDGGEK